MGQFKQAILRLCIIVTSKFASKVDSMRAVLLMISFIFLSYCNSSSCHESVEPENVTLKLERLDKELFNSKSISEVEIFLKNHQNFAQFFLHSDQYTADSILAKKIFDLTQNPFIDTLYQESINAFEKMDSLITTLEKGLGRLKVYYPNTPTPIVQTAVTGLYNDLFISNEHIMIGMDFFIGENASYIPKQIPEYILNRYTTNHLIPIILQFISSQYITTCPGDALLHEMINHGKSYYLLSKILPCTPDHILIGYTKETWKDIFDNDEIIWAKIVENKWLYETNHLIKQKFISDRPYVYEIGEKCPGRIGSWVGWQIINSYAEKTGASVKQIMSETDANKLFIQSGYKPSGN